MDFYYFLQATGSWDYSVRVWAIRKTDYWTPANTALQENGQQETCDGISLLNCLIGHTGNIHTVAFSRADMLVTLKTFYDVCTIHQLMLGALLILAAPQLHIYDWRNS